MATALQECDRLCLKERGLVAWEEGRLECMCRKARLVCTVRWSRVSCPLGGYYVTLRYA